MLVNGTYALTEINQTQLLAIYVRVSTDDQQERKTIESQIECAEKYCELHEIALYKIYKDDGIKGTLPLHERPVDSELVRDAQNKCFDTFACL